MPLHYVWWRLAMWVEIPGNVHVWLVISIQGCTYHKNRKNTKVDDFRGKCRKIMKYVTKGFIELCRFILSESFYHACFIKKAYSCKSTPLGTLPVQNWYLKSDLWHISVFRDKMCHLILKSKVEFTLCLRLIVFYRSNVVVTFFSILSKTLSVMSGWLSGASKWQRLGTFALGAHMLLLGQWGKGKYLLDTLSDKATIIRLVTNFQSFTN